MFLLRILSFLLLLGIVGARNYVIERTEVMNGHAFKTRWEQPWLVAKINLQAN